MSKSQPGQIGITGFVNQIRDELLKAQEAKQHIFTLDTVELEIKFVTEKEAKAGIKFWVASLGGKYSREQTHSVKLRLKPFSSTAQNTLSTNVPIVAQAKTDFNLKATQ